jgi:hypothetical protein
MAIIPNRNFFIVEGVGLETLRLFNPLLNGKELNAAIM